MGVGAAALPGNDTHQPAQTYLYQKTAAVKLLSVTRLLSRPALLAALLCAASSCAGSHNSLSQKTRWYKHHSSGKAVPCPCGH